MPKVALASCAGGVILLTGCTDEPLISQKMPGPAAMQNWAQQDQATNVQDWHRMARKIADAMQARGLFAETSDVATGAPRPASARQPFYVRSEQDSPFIRELSQALRSEIMQRDSSVTTSGNRAQAIDLSVSVVSWGSRLKSDSQRLRTEAIWSASISSQNKMLITIQEPFYIFNADIPQYVATITPEQQLVRNVRSLLYVR